MKIGNHQGEGLCPAVRPGKSIVGVQSPLCFSPFFILQQRLSPNTLLPILVGGPQVGQVGQYRQNCGNSEQTGTLYKVVQASAFPGPYQTVRHQCQHQQGQVVGDLNVVVGDFGPQGHCGKQGPQPLVFIVGI